MAVINVDLSNIDKFLKSLTIMQRKELRSILENLNSFNIDLNGLIYKLNKTIEDNTEIIINPEDPIRYYKMTPLKGITYDNIRFTYSPSDFVQFLINETKSGILEGIRQDYISNKNNANFIDTLFIRPRKEPSEEYWKGFKLGCLKGMNFSKSIFRNNNISEEKTKKLLNFLLKEGISICTQLNGSIGITSSKPYKEWVRYNLTYEDIKEGN